MLSRLQEPDTNEPSADADIPTWVLQESKVLAQTVVVPSAPTMDALESVQLVTGVPPKKDESGFFYIIRTPDVPEGVYKIGKTVMFDPNKRLCKYPTYSCCLYTIHVKNADLFEDLVMRKLKGAVKRRMEYGLEYYEADIRTLIDIVHQLWMKYGNIDEFKLNKSNEKIKPNGWQYFANEWLAKNPSATSTTAYPHYVNIIKTVFMSNEYAEFEFFDAYFKSLSDPLLESVL